DCLYLCGWPPCPQPLKNLTLRRRKAWSWTVCQRFQWRWRKPRVATPRDRKSTRLNSSHSQISYAVFCLKKKKKTKKYEKYEHELLIRVPYAVTTYLVDTLACTMDVDGKRLQCNNLLMRSNTH